VEKDQWLCITRITGSDIVTHHFATFRMAHTKCNTAGCIMEMTNLITIPGRTSIVLKRTVCWP